VTAAVTIAQVGIFTHLPYPGGWHSTAWAHAFRIRVRQAATALRLAHLVLQKRRDRWRVRSSTLRSQVSSAHTDKRDISSPRTTSATANAVSTTTRRTSGWSGDTAGRCQSTSPLPDRLGQHARFSQHHVDQR
jgi:hypothetical protein